MKTARLACTLGFIAMVPFGSAQANDGELPSLVNAPIQKVYVPTGFDDNDNVEVVLKGTFPNNCYRVGESKVSVDREKKEIAITATSYLYEKQPICLLVLTNFLQPVKVGLLEAGDYTVKVGEDSALTSSFSVAKRKTEAADDFLYANVENAYIKIDPESHKQSLVLQGTHPFWFTGCQKIKEVRSYRDPVDVLVVLPITEIVEDEEFCGAQALDKSFETEVPMESPFESEGMIHVRTLNGNSINAYIAPVF